MIKCTPWRWISFKKNKNITCPLAVVLLVLFFYFVKVFFCHRDMLWSKQQFLMFSPLSGLENRVHSFLRTQRGLLRCRFRCTFCADRCWTVCSDLFFFMCCQSENGILTCLFAAYSSGSLTRFQPLKFFY